MARKATSKAAPKRGKTKKAAPPAKKAGKRLGCRGEGKQQQRAANRAEVFVREYLVDLNGAQAAIRAGYSAAAARQIAYELLSRPDVQAAVQAAMDERAQRTGISADAVIKRIWAIATADPAELIEMRRTCCRFCWGKDHHYQWTPHELRTARSDYEREVAVADQDQLKLLQAPDETGGIGFDPRKDPNPDCPECFGEGEQRVYPRDTRDVSPAARLLYAGVKTTQHGIEIKMHDQPAMLTLAGKHLGLFKEKVELTGKNGGPVEHRTMSALLDEIDGAGTGLPDGGSE
jgi:hypothetical protein